MYTVRKQFKFEAAHQLQSAYSAVCTDSIHGHSYLVEVFLRCRRLNEDDMVLDFGILKDKLDTLWKKWDHSLILPVEIYEESGYCGDRQKKEVIVTPYNPTAEKMAFVFYREIRILIHEDLSENLTLWKVRVHETRTGWAEYEED